MRVYASSAEHAAATAATRASTSFTSRLKPALKPRLSVSTPSVSFSAPQRPVHGRPSRSSRFMSETSWKFASGVRVSA